ncbi:hypothetical protein F0L68_12275 [Solihabitans fulvus]|uniref:Uncharacterized protein n=1 Tax=Solihabitans fulvus TaxID=1892852 RepID=A0A5B2XHI1_9PSEU|nr:hypothetical protein [Solihabitans fulvus]KAA2262666.1 hypothetical protein F0L68_12275 [Solihabitans fulvus]
MSPTARRSVSRSASTAGASIRSLHSAAGSATEATHQVSRSLSRSGSTKSGHSSPTPPRTTQSATPHGSRGTVYRGDGRHPSEIFQHGFASRGDNYDLGDHIKGGSNLRATGYVSTSANPTVAQSFTQPPPPSWRDRVGLKLGTSPLNRMAATPGVPATPSNQPLRIKNVDGVNYMYRKGWIYSMDRGGNMTNANASGHVPPDYRWQEEWSAKRQIVPQDIQGAQRFKGWVEVNNNTGVPKILDPTHGPFVANPRYDPNYRARQEQA